MASLSISKAWEETSQFARREARLLYPVAFAFIALPSAVLQLLMPAPAAPGELPEGGAWLYALPAAAIAGIIGSIAITNLALRPGASVAESLQTGFRRFIFLLAAALLLGIGVGLAMIPVFLVVGLLAAGAGGEIAPGVAALTTVLMIALFVILWVRFIVMTAVTTVEAGGPIAILRRSWQLTAGHFWRLLGFALLFALVSLIAMLAVSVVGGLAVVLTVGPPEPGSTGIFLLALVGALINSVISAVFTTFVARIYAQLAGHAPADVFA